MGSGKATDQAIEPSVHPVPRQLAGAGPEGRVGGRSEVVGSAGAENGKRFRFKRQDIGDYALGYAAGANFPLAAAMAVSAAFPGGFGPLRLDADRFEWHKRPWDAPSGSEEIVDIAYKSLHLYDGGVYDNLGLEPFFDAGRGKAKQPESVIIVSDAGAPLPNGFSFRALNPFRLKRVADIMSDQARALRVRTFANYLQQGPGRGALFYIDTPVTSTRPCPSAAYATVFPTTLRRVDRSEFDRLCQHGHAVAVQVAQGYGLGID